jgi:hypothetical protein
VKRFTETNKWDDPWFIRLPDKTKLLWLYICDRCDASGVIDFCPEVASVQIGHTVTADQLGLFGESRVNMLPNGKWQIVKFLKFQYGTVDTNCPAHKPVIRLIEQNGLKFPINSQNRLSDRVSNTLQEKNKEKERGIPYQKPSPFQKPKLPAPHYDKLPPKRTPTDAEFAEAQRLARQETAKLKAKLA